MVFDSPFNAETGSQKVVGSTPGLDNEEADPVSTQQRKHI